MCKQLVKTLLLLQYCPTEYDQYSELDLEPGLFELSSYMAKAPIRRRLAAGSFSVALSCGGVAKAGLRCRSTAAHESHGQNSLARSSLWYI